MKRGETPIRGIIVKKTIIRIIIVGCIGLTAPAYSQSPSDLALHRRAIFTSPYAEKLTKSFTKTNWGTPLFINGRFSILQYVTFNPYEEIISTATFHIDQPWNRMVYEEYPKSWIRAYGTHGNGDGQFLWPRSLDAQSFCDPWLRGTYYRIYIADTENRRIVYMKYHYSDESLVWDHTITNDNLILPIDLNINNNGTFVYRYDDYIWVLDACQIKLFNGYDELMYSYGTKGCSGGIGEFCSPTAVVCGRSYIPEDSTDDPNSDNRYIYVADPGNNRIVWLERELASLDVNWCGSVSTTGSHIIDLEVDNFGQVWAADRDNGRLIKYTYDLFPLCTYGTTGAGEHQFFCPLGVSNPGGYWGCGNIMVTESWSDTSGIQYFDVGTDILDLSVSSSDNLHWHYVRYLLIDPSKVTVKIYSEPSHQLIKTVREGSELSGQSLYIWDGSDETGQMVPTGTYSVTVFDTSLYWNLESQQPGYTVQRSTDLFYHSLNPYSGYIPGDVNADSSITVGDAVYLISYIFRDGPAPQPFVCVGDVNGDGRLNMGDAVYLISYIFRGGAVPKDGCESWPE